jgi:hypothetical protein
MGNGAIIMRRYYYNFISFIVSKFGNGNYEFSGNYRKLNIAVMSF